MAHAHPQDTVLLREQIVSAALGLVEESGLDAVTMRSLARRLGYSPASLYMHFRGKEELLRAVAAEKAGALLDRVRSAARAAQPADGLRAFAEQLLDFAHDSHAFDRLIFDETPGAPFDSEEDALRTQLYETLAGLVGRALAARTVSPLDPAVEAAVAWGELRGLARLVRPEGPDPAPARSAAAGRSAALADAWAERWRLAA